MKIKFLLPAFVGLLVSCRDPEITHVKVPKAPPATTPASMSGEVPPPPAPAGGQALRWKLPDGWTESRDAGGMRYATLVAPVKGKVDVSVTVLPGSAGGELANVNRWRNQIGLPPLDEAGLASSRKPVRSAAGSVSTWDFTSEDRRRMVAGLLSSGGNSWFVKMVGDADAVAAARPDFLRLLETLRFDASP